ncbi:NAD-dependent epimerase/dehydratase family protein [Nonomuraea sp. NPDC052265]
MGNVLLTGATGGIGKTLVAALGEAGHRVIAVVRLTLPALRRAKGHVIS